ncbi:hypothetical protein [Nitratireductor sp. XY-223]|uniref:hypothetical protein n=1 Tax=Nitratireductor sp. XY-223 TaxID=2561926 RepID=UPI0010A9D182|nr:hypothetical protein [Nitratireductor sp. XY-223]
MVNQRIRERDLIEPVLRLIVLHGDDEGGLNVTKLDELLREQLTLSVGDREILTGRKDDRFSQVVRNLVSHRTLEKRGLAEYRTKEGSKRGSYYLTPRGAALLEEEENVIQPDLFD